MKRIELVQFNAELLQKLQKAGVKMDDWKHCDLFRDYTQMVKEGTKRTAIILILAKRYNLSERQVYNIIRHLQTPIPPTP